MAVLSSYIYKRPASQYYQLRKMVPLPLQKVIGRREFTKSLGVTDADELRLADYLDTEIEVALGHNQKTVTSGYGRLSQGTAKRLNEMFNRVEFQGLDIDHLYGNSL